MLKLPGVDAAPAWNTWIGYFKVVDQPSHVTYAGRIKLAGAMGFDLPLLAWLILLIPLFKRRPESCTATPASPTRAI